MDFKESFKMYILLNRICLLAYTPEVFRIGTTIDIRPVKLVILGLIDWPTS